MSRPARRFRPGLRQSRAGGHVVLSEPRVPQLEAARAFVWALLTLCALWPLLQLEGESLPTAPRMVGAECRLATEGAGSACPCGSWPARLRRVLDLPLPANRASAGELETIPGIGPRRAQAIIAEREAAGPYANASELARRVRGIGARTVARLDPYLFFAGPDPACAAKRS